MILIDEKTGNTIKIEDEALDVLFDHRLRLPKPKDQIAYHMEGTRKVPDIKHSDSLRHVQRECYHQMIENLKREMVANFDKYKNEGAELSSLQCGNVSIKRSVHIGFWKLLVRMYVKKPSYTVEDLNNLQPDDSDNFSIEIISAEIKERPNTSNTPMQISRAELERGA